MNRIKLFLASLIGSLTKRLLGPHVRALLVDTEDGMFAVDPEDSVVGLRLRRSGKWAPEEIRRIKQQLTPDSQVLIVGAHIGTLAIPLSRVCSSVVAIEANPVTYQLLVQNIALNRVANCVPVNIAANDKAENIKFLLSRTNSGGSKRAPISKHFAYYADSPQEISIEAARLDDRLPGRAFDVVVMDIEGSEYFALRGMQRILAGCRLLVVEFLPHHLRNVSAVSVEQFLATLAPHFSKLTIPPDERIVPNASFRTRLQAMYDQDEGNDGLMFWK
jgi:FkbM family methyltransferase